MAKFYLDAFNQKNERKYNDINFTAWLQGAYIREAVTVGVSYALDGKQARQKGVKYLEQPLDLFGKEKEQAADTSKADEESIKWMMSIVQDTNARFNS